MTKDPKKRIGSKNDNLDLREHPWLDDIDFDLLLQYKLNAPIIPEINNETDTDHFHKKWTNERPKMTMLSEDMINELKKYDKMFGGFYFDQISEKEKPGDDSDVEEEDDEVKENNDSNQDLNGEEDDGTGNLASIRANPTDPIDEIREETESEDEDETN